MSEYKGDMIERLAKMVETTRRKKVEPGWCSRCGRPWCDEHDCCSLDCSHAKTVRERLRVESITIDGVPVQQLPRAARAEIMRQAREQLTKEEVEALESYMKRWCLN